MAAKAERPASTRAPLIVGITGASGVVMACRAIEALGELDIPMHITYTQACRQVWPDEIGHPFNDDLADWK
ncbi:MAG TPA: flavoprotein, partial [Ktedonobacterales bacterium]|nr:flavoprotein [Ktedonobacterales bacterium]